jgi:predicted ester cyclase
MSNLEKNKGLLLEMVRAINEQDWRGLRNVLHPDFQRHSYAAGEARIEEGEDFVRFIRGQYEAFSDAKESIEDLFGEDDRLAARHRFVGTQDGSLGSMAPSGRVLTLEYLAIYRISDGRIAECWAEWDNLNALEQLGHNPA